MTKAEKIFIARMADEMVRNPGMTMDQAARAVLARDNEIVDMIMAKSEKGQAIRDNMAAKVYAALTR